MKVFDAHCDTVYKMEKQGLAICKNDAHLDIERMERFDTYIQVFASFIDKKEIKDSPMNHCLKLIGIYQKEAEKNKDRIRAITTAEDLEYAEKNGGVYSILSIEGGEALEGSLDALKMYFKMGVRLITLTWNYANEIADGITESRGGGLTAFGRQLVNAMEDMGVLIDVSHLSERGFWDVAELARYPFVASHSCAKALCSNPRNLTDGQIKAVISNRGCIGVNYYPRFLKDSGEAGAEDIADHIEYIIKLGGKDCVGLGSDYDGVDYLPKGIAGVQDTGRIFDILKSRKMTDNQIEKVAYSNFYRVFAETLKRN